MFYVYLIMDKLNGSFYTGMTSNLRQRLAEHKRGKTQTTAKMDVLELVFFEAFKSKIDAIRREKYLKTSKGRSSLRQIVRDSIK